MMMMMQTVNATNVTTRPTTPPKRRKSLLADFVNVDVVLFDAFRCSSRQAKPNNNDARA
jgi:hypothetical protein|tara:strand:+ start:5303 stop:5479 length:177 start_codon:yes stop_codon:yes gene_type:complete